MSHSTPAAGTNTAAGANPPAGADPASCANPPAGADPASCANPPAGADPATCDNPATASSIVPEPPPMPHASSRAEVRARSALPAATKSARAVSVLGARGKLIVSGSRDARIAAIAGHQRGRVSRTQLLAAGLSTSQVHHLARTDRLFRLHAGVHAVGHPAEVPLGRETAALLATRGGALLSHTNAAPVWGIDAIMADPDVVHLLVGTGVETRRAGIRSHRSRVLRQADRRIRLGLPVSSPARMLLDLAAELDERVLERALDQALVLGLTTHREIAELVTRAGGHHGRRALNDLAVDHRTTTVTRSEAEERLLALVRDGGLPEPRVNVRLYGYEVDFHWPEAALVVEVDGYRFHSTRAAFERDRIRDACLQAAGIEVLRVTWRRLESERLAVLVDIAAAIARRSPREGIDAWSRPRP